MAARDAVQPPFTAREARPIHESVIDAIGNTPIVRLSRLRHAWGVEADIYIKLEHLNVGGSHKARIAAAMIHDAEDRGVLRRHSGQTIIEPSGGNTGIGLAIAASLYGYRLVLVIPDNYSAAKQRLLALYGAEVILSDSTRGNNSHGELAQALMLENPRWVMLNQQRNEANPQIHRTHTGPEILDAFGANPPEALVAGIGTGGHITGLGQVLRERWPALGVIGVQPEGCRLLAGEFVQHRIQGLAVGLIPAVLDTTVIDEMVSVSHADAKAMCRELLRCEGIGVGLSSGANLAAVKQLLAKRPQLRSVLTLSYDGIEPYADEFD